MKLGELYNKLQSINSTYISGLTDTEKTRLNAISARLNNLLESHRDINVNSEIKRIAKSCNLNSKNLTILEHYLDGIDAQITEAVVSKVATVKHDTTNKPLMLSISVGVIVSIVLMTVGLILSFCVPEIHDKDTLYFVIESIKDVLSGILDGIGVGIVIDATQKRKQNINVFKKGIALMLIGGLGILIIFILAIFSAFGTASKLTYTILILIFMLLTIWGFFYLLFPEQKNKNL